jgi:hypothetical protein
MNTGGSTYMKFKTGTIKDLSGWHTPLSFSGGGDRKIGVPSQLHSNIV